jgi:hypothetical protein
MVRGDTYSDNLTSAGLTLTQIQGQTNYRLRYDSDPKASKLAVWGMTQDTT